MRCNNEFWIYIQICGIAYFFFSNQNNDYIDVNIFDSLFNTVYLFIEL